MPYVLTPSGARYHYELYGDGEEKVIFIAGFACCKAYWKSPIANLLKRGQLQQHAHSHSSLSLSRSLSHRQTRSNRYQICVFDTRGFGKSTVGSYARMSTSSMALDVLHILLHLHWIRPSSQSSPFYRTPSYDHAPPLAHTHHAPSVPVLNIVSWSLGGMVTQELSFLLLLPQSQLMHDLRSIVYTSSSPGGYRDPSEWMWAYLWRNQPPIEGYRCIAGMIVGSVTHSQRIRHALNLHFSQEYLNRAYTGEWPIVDDEECFCVDDCERATVRTLKSHVTNNSDGRQSPSSPLPPLPSPTHSDSQSLPSRPNTNRELLAYLYCQRSPFDRSIVPSLWALCQNVLAVYTHAFGPEKARVYHLHNRRKSIVDCEKTRESRKDQSHDNGEQYANGNGNCSVSAANDSSDPASDSDSENDITLTIPSNLPGPSPSSPSMIRVQPLVITGDHDILIAPTNSLILAHYLRCDCLLVNHSGHMMYIEHSDLYADLLHQHFTRARDKVQSVFEGNEALRMVHYQQNPYTLAQSKSDGDGESQPAKGFSWQRLLTCMVLLKIFSFLPFVRAINWSRIPQSLRDWLRPAIAVVEWLRSLLAVQLQHLAAWMKAL